MTRSEAVRASSVRTSPSLTPQEVICDLPLGQDPTAASLPRHNGGTLSGALEAVVLEALQRSPCMVSFSGGRDSSAVLAVSVDVARRHGLPEPIPVIMRLPNVPDSNETAWQELVLGHLRLNNEEVVTATDEFDALGPAATDVLMAHGLHWPVNACAHRPVIDLAHGGSLLTGIGGDEMFSSGYPHLTPRRKLLLASPVRAREAWLLRTLPFEGFQWLTPEGRDLARRGYVQDEATARLTWERSFRHWYRSRYFSAIASGLDLVAESKDVLVMNPFIEERVLVELVHLAGRSGFPSRTEAMRRLFGHLLPDLTLARQTKATFDGGVWGKHARRFAAVWSGKGIDPRLVDADRLRREFTADEPDFRCVLLLHQAWLHDHGPSRSTS